MKKRNKKKTYLLLLPAMALCLMAGCKGSKENSTTQAAEVTTGSPSVDFAGDMAGGARTTEQTADTPTTEDPYPAYDFTVFDQNGAQVKLSDYRGKVVLLYFWQSKNEDCLNSLDDLQSLHEKYKNSEQVAVLTAVFPGYGDEADGGTISDYMDKNEYTFPVLMDGTATMSYEYYVTEYPTTYIITKSGSVYGYKVGRLRKTEMEEYISQAMQ